MENNDNELLYLISEGSEEAYNIIYDNYKKLIVGVAKKYLNFAKKIGLEYNDLLQEGMIGLSNAINTYDQSKDVKFSTYVTTCVRNHVFSVLMSNCRKKHEFLNDSCSLEYIDEIGSRELYSFFADNSIDPSNILEKADSNKNLYDALCNELSDFEIKVLNLKMSDLEYKEIAVVLNKSYKSVDSALQRIKAKAKKVIEMLT